MVHEPNVITLRAHELITLHSEKAFSVAEAFMFAEMQQGDVAVASLWMAVMQLIKKFKG